MLLLTCMDKIYIHSYKKNSAGAFQSDALLVPEHCLFDHIHNQTKCWDFDQWNRTASNACQERGMKVKSFAMLLPCGIDVFSGVEFVCCPSSKAASTTKKGLHSVAFLSFFCLVHFIFACHYLKIISLLWLGICLLSFQQSSFNHQKRFAQCCILSFFVWSILFLLVTILK